MRAAALQLLGDMPRIPPWLIDRVIAELELTGKLVFPVVGGKKGYPTAFPRSLFAEIRALTGDGSPLGVPSDARAVRNPRRTPCALPHGTRVGGAMARLLRPPTPAHRPGRRCPRGPRPGRAGTGP